MIHNSDTPHGERPVPHAPSALRRWQRWGMVSRILMWIVALAALLFVAGAVVLYQVVLPRVQTYRPQLEQQASAALGVPVRIGQIEAHTGGWIPVLELRQIELMGPDGKAALTLDKVVATVSARSLWWLGFEQIYIDAPVLDIRRDAQGRFILAGLVIDPSHQGAFGGSDWFFSQPEVVLRRGTLRWTDELRELPSVSLQQVDLLIRNPGQHHQFRLEATPPPEWGSRFVLQADLKHALWETHEGDWRRWNGTTHASFERVDVAELRKYTRLGFNVQHGQGALRLWADVQQGQITGATADVALRDVNVTLGADLPPLELAVLGGRLAGVRTEDNFEFYTEGLEFTTRDGVKWPGGNVRVTQGPSKVLGRPQGRFLANRLDIAVLAQLANRLPLGPEAHRWLAQLGPKGQVQQVEASWQGEWSAPKGWKAKGVLTNIEVLSQPVDVGTVTHALGRPGIRHANVEFDASEREGHAVLTVKSGAMSFPGVLEEPEIPLEDFNASVQWTVTGDWPQADLDVQVQRVQFSNADVQGAGTVRWRTTRPGRDGAGRYPGWLELDMRLTRADGTRVHRYLPQGIPKDTRDYVREAVTAGYSDDVKIRVRGDLREFPFSRGQGEFRIQAQIKGATYAYVPARSGKAWPALTNLSGQLIFDRNSMQVKGASSGVAGTRALQTSQVQASIADLGRSVVVVQGDVQGPLTEMLDVVRQSQLQALTGGVLGEASAQGLAQTHLQLELPLANLDASKVKGSVELTGNDLRVTPDTPLLAKTRGTVQFSDKGFDIQGGQARFLGGDMQITGGTVARAGAQDATVLLKARGQATAQGLREARELGLVSQMARHASGSLSYTATLGIRRGKPEISLNSTLQGMALTLPAPLVKSADTALPVRYEQALIKGGDGLTDAVSLDVGKLLNVDIQRDVSKPTPRVLRGNIGVGQAALNDWPLPDEGVSANVEFNAVDIDAWERVLQGLGPASSSAGSRDNSAYWPNTLALQARTLKIADRQFNDVVVGASREGRNWRANMSAAELNGYLAFRQPQGNVQAELYARLARLSIGASTASDIESVLEQQPSSIPALDIVVEDMEYKGRKLGRVEIEATNRGQESAREWRLSKFNMTVPEATLQASGNWVRLGQTNDSAQGAPRARGLPRRTAMKFKLDIRDSGALLQRFGMGQLVRKAPGLLEGQISWLGSPFALDYPTLQGALNVDIRDGQFLKVDPGGARLLGVLSLQALPRRLILDFRDVFSEGFAFDNIRGDVNIESGIARTNNLQMKGVVAGVLMEGSADIARETQDLHVVVVPEINAGTASLFAAAVNPVIGLGTFLAQAIIRKPLIRSNTQEFRIEGSWSDPKVTKLESKDEPAPAKEGVSR